MKTHLLSALRLTLVLLILLGGMYTLSVWAVAQLAPGKGKGITIDTQNGAWPVQIAQAFRSPGYFHARPSAVDHNAAGSGGSNKAPFDSVYLSVLSARIDTFMRYNPAIPRKDIPAELLTAGGSGLDPHISVQAALVQVPRISRERNLPGAEVEKLVMQAEEPPFLYMFGPRKIHVLRLNLALDAFEQNYRK